MRRLLIGPVLAFNALCLSGCVASMAASAVSMIASKSRGPPQSNEQSQPAAAKACTERAAVYGTVRIIDVEQRNSNKIIVWGTVDDGQVRRSFECSYGKRITGFQLRSLNK